MRLPDFQPGLFRMISFASLFGLFSFFHIPSAFPQYSNYRTRGIGLEDGLINPKVLSICADRYGYIWMGTKDGIDRYDGLTFREYRSGEESGLPSVKMVTNFFLDASGTLWCLSDNKFITTYSYEEDRFSIVDTLPENLRVTDFLIDDSLNIWIGTRKGLSLLKKKNERDYSSSLFTRKPVLPSNQCINKIYKQSSDLLWLATTNGLYRLRISEGDTLVSKYYFEENETAFYINDVASLTSDKNGNIWLATGSGLFRQHPSEIAADTGIHVLEKHEIPLSKMLYENIGLGDYGYVKALQSIIYNNDALFIKNMYGIYEYKILTGEWSRFAGMPVIQFMASGDRENLATFFYNSSDRLLWSSTNNGILIINTAKAEFETTSEKILRGQQPKSLLYVTEDSNKRKFAIQFVSSEKLHELENFDWTFSSTEEIDTLFVMPSLTYVTTKEDEENYCWFISQYFGVLKYLLKNDTLVLVRLYTRKDGLPNDFFIDIIADRQERLWIMTFQALTCLDPVREVFYNFNDFKNIRNNRFLINGYLDKEGYLHLPTFDGVVIVNPDELLNTYLSPIVVISKVYNAGKAISRGNKEPVEPAVIKSGSINIPYHNNSISIELGNLNFLDPNSCIFMYKMDGIDKEWKNNRENRNISYGSLNPGRYSFHAFAIRKDGMMKSEEVRLDLTITPAFYQKPVFYALIIFLILIILFATIKIREKNLNARAAYLEKEVQNKTAQIIEHSAEMEKMKNRFYTNVSHEFRTPLTLINSSAREIERVPDIKNIKKFTGTIFKSCERLLRLVNELLDLSRLEAGKMDLKVAEGDLASVVRLVYQNYISDAERRGITYSFRSDPEIINCWFDREMLRKITHNLISNALKFTPGGRSVTVEVIMHQDDDGRTSIPEIPFPRATIVVKDTGNGINPEHLSKIFDRFYQADSSITRGYEGTGIGLAIVNEMSFRHHGKAMAESCVGEGSEFTVIVPVGKSHYGDDERLEKFAESSDDSVLVKPLPKEKQNNRKYEPGANGKQVVLVVEDNDDLREFLTDLLGKRFRVIEAVNGKEGLEKAEVIMPDIIISDIMMPEVDGVDLCSKVKNNNMTCHIPVILLTAKADIDSRLEGLRTGADDYLTKPFNEEELAVRIDNLILIRQKLREKFVTSPVTNIPGIRTGCSDESLMKELLKAIETNMIKSSFSVEDIAAELRVGKRSLQRKIKSMTGITASEFIGMIKIKHAASLIAERKATVSEAAYATGFSSLSHFTRNFRKITGMNPSEYKKSVS